MFRNPEGVEVHDHDAKAQILWEAYNERMGSSEFSHMYVDLASLLIPRDDLDWLDTPFTKEEIDKVIADLPNHKSSGLDGFNGEFQKKC
jgi:hypothetical protein